MKTPVAFIALAALAAGTAMAQDAAFSVSGIFSDHMVLQRGKPVPVWGEAAPGTKVSVRFGDASAVAVAGADGEWCATLPAMPARAEGGTLAVKADGGAGEAAFDDVLVGDVWLCGGQSNMELATHAALGAKEEAAKAADYPNVRGVRIENCRAFRPVKRVRCTPWDVCMSDRLLARARGLSAVGYYFARELNRETGVPQGFLHDNWGGCRIEPFIPLEGLKGVPQLRTLVEEVERAERNRTEGNQWTWNYRQTCAIQYGKYLEACRAKKVEPEYLPNTRETMQGYDMDPTAMFNAMIAPLTRFPIAGVLWYQGESNVGEETYPLKLKALADGWRKAWGYDVPFCVFQLSSIGNPDPNPAQNPARPRTRDDQRRASQAIPDCGFVVTTDVGATYEHPLNKRDVGERAARWALHRIYGRKDVVPSGPMFAGFTREGDKLRVRFDHVGGGLVAADKDPEKPGVAPVPKNTRSVKGFTIQDENGTWHTAEAVIDGDCVVVSAPGVKNPKGVRYAHVNNTMGLADLYNAEGLPAAAFRTDTGKAGAAGAAPAAAAPRKGGTALRGVVTEPRNGAVVSQILPEQKAFFALPRETKLDMIMTKEGHAAIDATWPKQQWGRPQHIRIEWKPNDGVKPPPEYVLKLIRASDGVCVKELKRSKPYADVHSLEIATRFLVRVYAVEGGVETPFAESEFETEDYAPRLVDVSPVNVRDLGGRIGLGGRRVRQGLVFRSAALNADTKVFKDASGAVTNFVVGPFPSPASAARLTVGHGIRTDLDLRSDDETYGLTGSPLGAGVRYVQVPATFYGEYYASDKARALFKRCFDVFLDDANYPILFHCRGGADRTGSLAFLLNALLGVSEDELDNDFLMTRYSLQWRGEPFGNKTRYLQLVNGLKALPGETLADKAASYCRQCGITDDEIARFREKMLEPAAR